MTVHLHIEKRGGEWESSGYPLPPFTAAREPTLLDKDILVFGKYEKKDYQHYVCTAVVATIEFEPEQTLEERKAEVLYAIDLCELVHRARSDP